MKKQEEKNHKNSKFKCLIRISKKNREWIRENNNGYTLAGKLDEIINLYKKHYANETMRKMSREQMET